MRYSAAILAIALAAGLVVTAENDAPPTPSAVPASWELQFECQAPQSITLALPGDKTAKTYWYLLYTVTNRSGADQEFTPHMVLYTDTGRIHLSGEDVPTLVFQAIRKRHNNPLLTDQSSITGRMLQGEDNAKDGVAIWPDFDPEARGFDIFIGGLSGERAKIKLPVPVEVAQLGEDGKRVMVKRSEEILQKTLQLGYSIPGIDAARPGTRPKLVSKSWVMR